MKKIIYCLVVVCLLAGLFLGCAPTPTPTPTTIPTPTPTPTPTTEPIELKAISFMPDYDPTVMCFLPLIDKINERAKGELVIRYVGGPEAIPGFEQFEAVRTGVVDMALIFEGYYGDRVTGLPITHLTDITPWEERESGYHDLRVEILKEHNIYYLGKGISTGFWFSIGVNKRIDTPWDLAGQKIRVSPPYMPLMKALGATGVVLPMPDVYPALERGVVDGFMWACIGIVDFGWNEVTKYLLAPRFYNANNENLMNLDTWNSLPKHLQDLMMQCQMEIEREMSSAVVDKAWEERQRMIDGGMELIEFSSADTEAVLELSYNVAWKAVMEKVQPPELGPKLKEVMSK